MKKIIFSLLLLCSFATAQTTREISQEINLGLQTDSVSVGELPAGVIVTKCIVYVDTTITAADSILVKLSSARAYLSSFKFVAETDVIGTARASVPDKTTGTMREAVWLYYSSTGDGVTGRVRIYVEYVELF
jgi:hypothetical protein